MTLIQTLNRFPPCLCRLVARKGRTPLTLAQIASLSGLSVSTVRALSAKKSWCGVSIDAVQSFSSACGVDILHPRRQIDFLRRRKKAHWRMNNAYYNRFIVSLSAQGQS